MTDRDWVALTIYGEARGESVEGRIAVACVLRNRLKAGKWGRTYEAVCLAPKQFSCWNADDPNRALLQTIANQIRQGKEPKQTTASLRECYWIADGLLSEAITPRVGPATHYHATWLKKRPAWALTGEIVATVGRHTFFARVA